MQSPHTHPSVQQAVERLMTLNDVSMLEKAVKPLNQFYGFGVRKENRLGNRIENLIKFARAKIRGSFGDGVPFKYVGDLLRLSDQVLQGYNNVGTDTITEIKLRIFIPLELELTSNGVDIIGWPERADPLHGEIITALIKTLATVKSLPALTPPDAQLAVGAPIGPETRTHKLIRPFDLTTARGRLQVLKLPPSLRATALNKSYTPE